MTTDPWGPLGLALLAYYHGDRTASVQIRIEDGNADPLSVAEFFRDGEELPDVEQVALDQCCGRVLDLGAGAGTHALALQARSLEVVALDVSPLAVEVMRHRGVRDARLGDLFAFSGERFDTVLLMMNGIGVVGDLAGLDRFLDVARGLIEPGGQVLFDSTDLRLGADDEERAQREARVLEGRYFGQVRMRMTYRGRDGAPYFWLFLDPETLADHAAQAGWRTEILHNEPTGEFAARLTRSE
jgi:SAM-dependent methyltransferase